MGHKNNNCPEFVRGPPCSVDIPFEKRAFRYRVKVRGRFVHEKNERLGPHHRPTERHFLPLATREIRAVFERWAKWCVETTLKLAREVSSSRSLQCVVHAHRVLQPFEVADTHGLTKYQFKTRIVLKRCSEPCAPAFDVECRKIDAVDGVNRPGNPGGSIPWK